MKVVISGSESFVARELRRHCAGKGIEVVGFDSSAVSSAGNHAIDIRDPKVADIVPQNADALIHLAAISRDQDCRRDTTLAFDVNVGGTLNLIRAAKQKQVRQFIFASSEWVYGNCSPSEVQTEETVIDANKIVSEYALTKIAGERLLCLENQRGFCPVTVLRFGIVYGPRPTPMCPVEGIFNDVRTKDTVEMNCSLNSGRRFIHVSDVADGILACVGRTGFELFNLSGDELITFGKVIEESSRLLGKTPKVVEKNSHVLNVRNPDNGKIKKTIGWAPRVGLRQGLSTLLAPQGCPQESAT